MADTALQTVYRTEFIKGYEQRQSLLRDTVTTQAQITGNQAVFLVADTGSATATTRGANGLIPARADNLSQPTATLGEWHDLTRKNNFNLFAGQGDQRAIMQQGTMAVMNRKVDDQILTELATATNDTGAAVAGSVQLAIKAKVILGNNKVPWDGGVTLLASAGFMGYLIQAPEFSNAQYVNLRPWETGANAWRDVPAAYRWLNMLIIEHPALSLGTAAEKCYMFHRSAVGHAIDMAGLKSAADYHAEQDYSWARCTAYMGAKLLQNSGVVVINHDGSAFAAS